MQVLLTRQFDELSVAALTDEMAAMTDAPRLAVVGYQRSLQQGKALPASARRRDMPQIDTVHATAAFLAVMKAGAQVNALRDVWDTWRLRPVDHPGAWMLDCSFGERVAGLINMVASENPADWEALRSHLHLIEVSRGAPQARITVPGEQTPQIQWFGPLQGSVWRGGTDSITTTTAAGHQAIINLGLLVRHSRRRADQLGYQIPIAEAHHALGLNHPGGPGRPHAPAAEGAADPVKPGAETEEAEGLPHPSASGLLASPQDRPGLSNSEGSEGEGMAQRLPGDARINSRIPTTRSPSYVPDRSHPTAARAA